jgi:aldehyde dehydrogenase (NAD+)
MMAKEIHSEQQKLFASNKTRDIDFRIGQLKKLKAVLKANEDILYGAIYKDFGKSEFETYASELALVYHELNLFIKNLWKWSKPKKVATGLANFPAKSYIITEPLGNTLIIGAWNYPFLLTLHPVVNSLAAGNTVILKPSELSANTSKVLEQLINKNFDNAYFAVVEGGAAETTEILKLKFDKIFFTGSTKIGRIIYEAAAKQLCPVALELGGKSPTFVLADCDIKVTVKRIVWAKFLNAGQTCVAPDYILVEKKIESKFLEALKREIEKYHEPDTKLNDNYLRIINLNHFKRLNDLIDPEKIYYGGLTNMQERFIGPTVFNNISFEDEIMQDEIFGPLLPVIGFENLDTAIQAVKARPKPLACYVYSKNKKNIQKLLHEVSFGGGAVNDSVMHLSNSNLPFGGVGLSGIGNYHGKAGLACFSHQKSILHKPFWIEPNIKYPPYSKLKMKIIKFLLE